MGKRATGCLDLHGTYYRLRVQVPRHLRGFFDGQHSLTQVLPTDSKTQANRLRPAIVNAMIDQIREAERRQLNAERSATIDKQMLWAAWVAKVNRAHKNRQPLPEIEFPGWLRLPWPKGSRDMRTAFWLLHNKEAEEIAPRFESFRATVEGNATPLEAILPTYIQETARKPRQQADCERAIKKLTKFMVEHQHPTTIEHLTRRMVGDWVSSRVKLGHHWKTINKDISFCSGLFKYGMRRGLVELNPFSLQALPKVRRKTKRAYTKPEVQALLNGGGGIWLIESILILALSGMRADELAHLRVQNCKNGIFQLLDTKRGNRNVPIHSSLRKIIERRCAGKGSDEFLFHEFPTPKNLQIERSQFLSKHFARYRKKLGFDERGGGRQSAVDLHSLRRFFITQADAAGHRKEDIERVVGHHPQSLSLGLYADPLSIQQMRKVIESVRV